MTLRLDKLGEGSPCEWKRGYVTKLTRSGGPHGKLDKLSDQKLLSTQNVLIKNSNRFGW